ncbi:MAG: DUF6428 family protein [Bacteroidota bacterium]
MKLSEIKTHLQNVDSVNFILSSGEIVPKHFHVTEIGVITKHFIDCGGKERLEKVVNFQLWDANDFDHRLSAEKLLKIISLSEKTLHIEDLEIEVEYQSNTIGKYNLEFDGVNFILAAKKTACLASDSCGVDTPKTKVQLSELQNETCKPGGKCC